MVFTFSLILYIVMVHFLADFSVQTPSQALKKSTDNLFLLKHILTYSLVWFVFYYIYSENLVHSLIFFLITFGAHGLTDYITSRMVKGFFDKKDYHNGFLVIGADQVAHHIQLFLTFILLNT